MNQLTNLYHQLETAGTVSERFELWKSIKVLEKEIESNRNQSAVL